MCVQRQLEGQMQFDLQIVDMSPSLDVSVHFQVIWWLGSLVVFLGARTKKSVKLITKAIVH